MGHRVRSSIRGPRDGLGLVDRVTVVVGCGHAGCGTDGAIDVGDGTGRSAHELVIFIPDPRFVRLPEELSLRTNSVSDIATLGVDGCLRSQTALPAQTADLA